MKDDAISRQAATTIPVMPKEHRYYQTNNLDDAYEQGWNDLQECIENLPPVQTEIIHCKDCKHWNPQFKTANGNGLGSCDFHNVALVTSEGFCYWADRRGEAE